MKKSFNSYLLKTKKTFKDIKEVFQNNNQEYVPQLQITQSEILIDSPKKMQEANKDFFNRENVYLRIISIMKQYLLSQEKNFINYLKWNIQLKILNKILTKIQLEKTKCYQLSVLMYLIWTNNKKLIKIYIKYRQQILQKCTFDKTKNNSVCLHNQAKYLKETVFIGQISVQFQVCQFMIQYFHSQIPIQMIQWLGQGKKSVDSLQLLHVFLWQTQNKELVHHLSSQMEHQNN